MREKNKWKARERRAAISREEKRIKSDAISREEKRITAISREEKRFKEGKVLIMADQGLGGNG